VEPKPQGWERRYAEWFGDRAVVSNYRFRPPYSDELFELLATSAGGRAATVLDAGTGPGDIARPLARRVASVDAVDLSTHMIEEAKTREGGDSPNITWIVGPVEEVDLRGPYDLITAGDSIHWFDWRIAMPRFADQLGKHGQLALIARDWITDKAVRDALAPVYDKFGANRDFRPADPITELETRGLFEPIRRVTTKTTPWHPTLDELLGCHHSQNGFAPQAMGTTATAEFDAAIEGLFAELNRQRVAQKGDDRYHLDVRTHIVWGRPLPGLGHSDH
jgi:SAM-dependent methyltransferase